MLRLLGLASEAILPNLYFAFCREEEGVCVGRALTVSIFPSALFQTFGEAETMSEDSSPSSSDEGT